MVILTDGFGWVLIATLIVLPFMLADDALKKRKARRQKEEKESKIHSFVSDALEKNEIYPIWNWNHTLHGITGGSAHRAAKEYGLDPHVAATLIRRDLISRGLPTFDPNSP